MTKPRIVFLYNLQHERPDPNNPRSLLQNDFLDQETVDLLKSSLESYFAVIPIEADEEAYSKLKERRNEIDIVFNLAEGLYTLDSEAQFPALLDILQIPYTGSGVSAQSIICNKSRTKEVLKAHGIPTPSYQVYQRGNELRLKEFPLILKLDAQGSSIGLSDASVVYNEKDLMNQADWLIDHFSQGVLIEGFVKGRELTVSMIGNPPNILPLVEKDYSRLPKRHQPISGSVEVRDYFGRSKSRRPVIKQAKVARGLERKVKEICLEAWKAIGVRDWARFDIRCDESENPFILEVNAPCGLTGTPEYPASFVLAARLAGLEFDEMLREIVHAGLSRYRQE